MESVPWFLQYIAANAIATCAGMIYWMSIENLQPPETKQKQHQKLALAALISLLITPIGLLLVSMALRLRKIAPTLSSPDE